MEDETCAGRTDYCVLEIILPLLTRSQGTIDQVPCPLYGIRGGPTTRYEYAAGLAVGLDRASHVPKSPPQIRAFGAYRLDETLTRNRVALIRCRNWMSRVFCTVYLAQQVLYST